MNTFVTNVTSDCDEGDQMWKVTVGRRHAGRYYGGLPDPADLPTDVLEALRIWATRGLASR